MLVHCKPHLSPVYVATHGKRYQRDAKGDVAQRVAPIVRRGAQLLEADGTLIATGKSADFADWAARRILSERSK